MSTKITAENDVEFEVCHLGIDITNRAEPSSIWARLTPEKRVALAEALNPASAPFTPGGLDDTNLKAAEIMAAIGKAVATTSPESYLSILAALGRYHQALADAGLLAPAPLREEWGTQGDDGLVTQWHDYGDAANMAHGLAHPLLRRHRTDWLPADGVNRAEGDGRAVL